MSCQFRYERKTEDKDKGDSCGVACAPSSPYCLKHAQWMRRKLKRRSTVDHSEKTEDDSHDEGATTENKTPKTQPRTGALVTGRTNDFSVLMGLITDISTRLTALETRVRSLELARPVSSRRNSPPRRGLLESDDDFYRGSSMTVRFGDVISPLATHGSAENP